MVNFGEYLCRYSNNFELNMRKAQSLIEVIVQDIV